MRPLGPEDSGYSGWVSPPDLWRDDKGADPRGSVRTVRPWGVPGIVHQGMGTCIRAWAHISGHGHMLQGMGTCIRARARECGHGHVCQGMGTFVRAWARVSGHGHVYQGMGMCIRARACVSEHGRLHQGTGTRLVPTQKVYQGPEAQRMS